MRYVTEEIYAWQLEDEDPRALSLPPLLTVPTCPSDSTWAKLTPRGRRALDDELRAMRSLLSRFDR